MSPELLNKLKKQLVGPLPGASAHTLLAPYHRQIIQPETLNPNDYKLSAVMILFCKDEQGELFLPLIQRIAYDGVHSGQISFPGGKFDEQDQNLEITALRECYEEIGIQNNIEILGKLTQLYIPVSGFLVEPYIGLYDLPDPNFIPHTREVQQIHKLYLKHFLKDEIIKTGSVKVNESLSVKAPFFELENNQIWGATAMILSELRVILKAIY